MSMPGLSLLDFTVGLLASIAILPALSAESAPPNFNPDGKTAWGADRRTSDDFLPHPKGSPGQVDSPPDHPYTPNGATQPTYRQADLSNPILQPWVRDILKAQNEKVAAGAVPFSARERC